MKRTAIVILLCLGLLLMVYNGLSKAADLELYLPFARHHLMVVEDMPDAPWWQSHTLVDANGGIHTAFYTSSHIYYAHCIEDCALPGSWITAPLFPGDHGSLAYPSLAFTEAGSPRIMWYDGYGYYYAECSADCHLPSSWTKARIELNPFNFSNYPSDARYFAIDAQERPRFVSYFYNGLTYAFCDTNCTSEANWYYVDLELGLGLNALQLDLNSSGQPRVIGVDSSDNLIFAQCDLNCTQAQSWSKTVIGSSVGSIFGSPIYSLRLDSQNRPRIAYFKQSSSDPQMYFAWSNSNYSSSSSWTTGTLPLSPASSRTIDMAIDSQDRPHIVFASNSFDLRYLRCLKRCDSVQSEWDIQDIETGDDLELDDPMPPDPGYMAASWWIEGYASLALDSQDIPYVSYYVRNVQFYNIDPLPRAWGIRFATMGESYLPPPPILQEFFLPLLSK
jgi:hypothetical protein